LSKRGKKTQSSLEIEKNILISNTHPSLKAPITHRLIKSEVSKVMTGEKAFLDSLSVNFVNRKRIKSINIDYLGHDYYTDIITFGYNESKNGISGEIFMCLDVIKENASRYQTSYKNEFRRVLIHGCLHLSGYDDRTKKSALLIRQREDYYLSLNKEYN
jgi:probable rRNA maturation factor